MKTCRNCRVVYGDEYVGTCTECGAPMGGVPANGSSDLSFRFARQTQEGQRENAQEQSMRRGRYDNVKVNDGILDVARQFVVVDEAKLARLQAQNA